MQQVLVEIARCPSSVSTVNLYSKFKAPSSACRLHELKAAKVRALRTLRASRDLKVQKVGEAVQCGKKWQPKRAVTDAEA